MPAVTEPDAYVLRILDDMRRPLIVEDMIGFFCEQDRFLHKNARQLGIQVKKQTLDEVLFHIDVLVKQLAKVLLIDISSGPHQGKFKEPDHRRGKDKLPHSIVTGIDHKPFLTQVIQEFFRFCFRCTPDPGGLL